MGLFNRSKKLGNTSPVSISYNTLVEGVRKKHRTRPVLMVFVTAVALVLVASGSVYAFLALTNDRATFRSTINSSSPTRQHILRVDGAGELIATLTDKTEDAANRVRFSLSLLNAEGSLLQNVVANSAGGRVKLTQSVQPGDYTFIVTSEDDLTETGASYVLKVDYPNDVAKFEDKIAPTLTISSPELGGTVSGVFTISGAASDETELAQVAVKFTDEDTWVIADGTTSWSLSIDSAAYSNGQKILTVKATDASGNTVTEQTLVNFENDITLPEDPAPTPTPEPTPSPDPGTGGDTGSSGSGGGSTSATTFFEDFTGNSGKENLKIGVYHRNLGAQVLGQAAEVWGDNNAWHGGSWTGDHDLSCGAPPSQRQLSSSFEGGSPPDWTPTTNFNLDNIVYVCRDHLMTSMGDVDGYSILWFAPNKSFTRSSVSKVSWDVNVTDLKARQWWEVSLTPVGTPHLASISWLAGTAGIDTYDSKSVIIGSGPFGNTVNITTNGEGQYDGWQPLCGTYGLDPEGCASKAIRRTFSVTDNKNGTLTVDYGGMFTQTVPGKFPDNFEVYFKDHNYTPDKDGMPVGHTWHWDNISVQ